MSPTWEDFQRKHVLDPRRESNHNHDQWTREGWNNWLRRRVPDQFGQAGRGGRSINSVIIATPDEILDDFRQLRLQYESRSDHFWSNNQYPMYLMRLSSHAQSITRDSPYTVNRLGPMHFVAAINRDNNANVPVHFHNQSPRTISKGNIKTPTGEEIQ